VNQFQNEIREPDFARGSNGLLPTIAQDAQTHQVLMLAWMNREAFQETCRTGQATYYSRSRGKLWRKGEESGHRQKVLEIRIDCDADTILLLVEQQVAACHEGYASCFFRTCTADGLVVNQTRLVDPESVYPRSQST
jgi:phosphoribosyl-AMP cyclohydrolase